MDIEDEVAENVEFELQEWKWRWIEEKSIEVEKLTINSNVPKLKSY